MFGKKFIGVKSELSNEGVRDMTTAKCELCNKKRRISVYAEPAINIITNGACGLGRNTEQQNTDLMKHGS
jgi:hypothetical protein